ncbi:MAG: PAS domain S-box protein, partial [Thermoanaerobaculia bacterium]|nr:PAS domain S-box protein [Thermoanaerobaculia bacterium]
QRADHGEIGQFTHEKRYVRPDGSEIWASLTVTGIHGENGNLSHYATVVQDLTEKKNAQLQLLERERFTSAVLDSLPFEVAVVGPEGRIRMVNDAWEEFALSNGLDSMASVGIGSSYLDVCPPDIADELKGVITGDRTSLSMEYPCHAPDEKRWFLMEAVPLETAEGGAVVSHVDITDRVLAEQQLARSEHAYRTIVETMGEGLFTLDRENTITYVNRRFCEITGYEDSELLGANVIDLLAFPEDRDEISRMSNRRLEGHSDEYESRMRHKDGHEIIVIMSAVPVFNDSGEVIGKLSVASDVTEKKRLAEDRHRLREQIQEMNRIESLGKLAGKMAHEFNNVLMGIQPFADVVERCTNQNGGDERVLHATRQIADAVSRGRRISQEVLRFARPTKPERTLVGTRQMLEEIGAIGSALVRRQRTIEVDHADEDLAVEIDREQIDQVFTNLVINARDASPDGSKISIEARRDPAGSTYSFGVLENPDRFVHFAVTDEGSGIPENMLKS